MNLVLWIKQKLGHVAKAAQRGWIKPGHKYVRRWWDHKTNRWRYEYYEAEKPDHHHNAEAVVGRAGEGKVAVAIEYDPDLKDTLKRLGGRWNPDLKAWEFDVQKYLGLVRPKLRHVIYTERAFNELRPHLEIRGEIELQEGEEGEGAPTPYPDGFPRIPPSLSHKVPPIPPESAKILRPEQLEDAQKILERMTLKEALGRSVPTGLVLANGTGTGKTYIYGAAIAANASRKKKALVVVPNKDLAEQTQSVLSQFRLQDGTPLQRGIHYEIATYPDLRTAEKLNPLRPWARDLLVFDEAHRIKRMFGSDRSQQAEGANELLREGGFAVYSTATPFDRPWEAKYLAFSGIHRTKGKESFDDFIVDYGVRVRQNEWGGKEYAFVGDTEDLKRLHEDLVKGGFLTKRLYRPEAPVSYESPTLEVPPEERALLEAIRERFEGARGLVKALGVNLQRAILERAKARAIIPLVEQEIKAGRSVAVFFQYLREKRLSAAELAEAILEEEEGSKSKEVLREFVQRLRGLDIYLESPIAILQEKFADLPGGVALYTGEQTQAQLRKAKQAFNEGRTKLLLATAAKGGTGLSFHDTQGNRPTTQVILTLPWTATELDQMMGRVVRTGMRSDVRILLPTSNAPVERALSAIIGERLKTLGYAVRGGEMGIPPKVLDAFSTNLFKLDPGKVEKALEELGKSLAEAAPQTAPDPIPSAQGASVQTSPKVSPKPVPLLLHNPLFPLFPELEPSAPPAKKRKETGGRTKRSSRAPRPEQPPLFPTGPYQPSLFELAKALGIGRGTRLLLKAEVRNIPVGRLRWVDRPSEREKVPASHYLLPKERKFPHRNKDGSINCRLLRAAISRAAQHGYEEVERRARALYQKHCGKEG